MRTYPIPIPIMPKYKVSSTHFFRETGERIEAGDTVELTEEQAEERNKAHPGLLALERRTTQGSTKKVIRGEEKKSSRAKK